MASYTFHLSTLTVLALLGTTIYATPLDPRAGAPILSITNTQWAALNRSVGGRLHAASPFAKPCYSYYDGNMVTPDVAACTNVQMGYTDEQSIANNFGGYINPNWGACQSRAQRCVLDFNAPQNPSYYAPPANCFQGSVPSYYIEVQKVSDVQAALKFSNSTGVPLVIKNSGHDFKGRSAAPNTLALWTHNIQPAIKLKKNFVPDGCAAPEGDAVTLGAGQGFAGVYEFAEANNITVVGGSSRTVGPVGGWISGGGHSALSNTLGLGVDNVMQIRTVLPNGTYVTANRCQNQDLFFALRGGGGSTFGVNMEMTTRAHPQMTLQVAYIRFAATDTSSIQKFVQIITEQGDKFASEGWGGYITPGALSNQVSGLILMTPSLSYDEAVTSMKPLTDYVASMGNVVLDNSVKTSDSFYQAYQTYISPNQEKVGVGIAIGSRLIPRSLFQTAAGQKALAQAIERSAAMVIPPSQNAMDPKKLTYGPPFQILVTAPSNYKTDGTSAVTPTWYDAAWHIALGQGIANDASADDIQQSFQTAHEAAQVLREVAPDSGAYINEADVFEPNPEETYWGMDNYNRLLALKKQIDPANLLTCWGCIGWNQNDPRYGCYPSLY